jgi:hypothetical protein
MSKSNHSFVIVVSIILFSLLPLPLLAQDSDGDGMPDWWEDSYPCVDSQAGDSAADADGEGLTNLEEYGNSTDPCNIDTDEDGLDDLMEVAVYGTDPNHVDTDGEGLIDFLEVQIYDSNPLNIDTDGDGLSDAFEVGIVIAAGPNGVLDSDTIAAPANGDSVHDYAVWLGADMWPGTTANGDDLQVIPRFPDYPRLFITDPDDHDSDGDNAED